MSKTNDELTVFVKATKNLNLHIATRNRAVTQKVKRKIQLMMGKLGDTNKILIQVPYSQELMKKVKTIHGSRWNPGEKYWEVP